MLCLSTSTSNVTSYTMFKLLNQCYYTQLAMLTSHYLHIEKEKKDSFIIILLIKSMQSNIVESLNVALNILVNKLQHFCSQHPVHLILSFNYHLHHLHQNSFNYLQVNCYDKYTGPCLPVKLHRITQDVAVNQY